jgi:hypothetical protein
VLGVNATESEVLTRLFTHVVLLPSLRFNERASRRWSEVLTRHCNGRAVGDDSRYGRDQAFHFAADLVERSAAFFQALKLQSGIFEL